MLRTKSQILNVSSLNAINGDFKSQVNITLPDQNYTDPNIKAVYISVQHAEVPNSFYIVNYTNNTLIINSITYTLQRGNYSATSFITYLLTILPSGFAITYSTITNKYTITYSTNFTINAGLSTSTINSVMGLGNSNLTSIANTLTLPNCVNFLPLSRLNFRAPLKLRNFNQIDNSGDILLSLQNNAAQMGVINFSNTIGTRFLIPDKSITSFVLSVTNDVGQVINFNGCDWYLTFQIDVEFWDNMENTTFRGIIQQYQNNI
jgi:hypothetical protein